MQTLGNMFHEEDDWNDAADVPSQSVVKNNPNSNRTNVKKNVGKKVLLQTLQTLQSIPDWKVDDDRHQPNSDSDDDDDTGPCANKKKKKKRRKRTKQGSATTGEQENNGDVKEKKSLIKKEVTKKTAAPKRTKTPAGKEPGEAAKLSRQQWKNKMKNKRKCKNKYLQNKPQDNTQTDDKPLSRAQSSKRVKAPDTHKLPQKRKKTEDCAAAGAPPTKTVKAGREKTVDGSTQAVGQNGERLKRQRFRKLLRPTRQEEEEEEEEPGKEEEPQKDATEERSSTLRQRMERRLEAARFRYINQFLYSNSSGEAKRMFQQDPQAFEIYHKGFTEQVRHWPANPVDAIIAYICNKSQSLVVADFGCGDCKIARSVSNKVHSFDLVATCPLATVCDMARVPLRAGSVDIAVFCLSLMGTNLPAFLAEANRVLKRGGVLKVAEVASRFDDVRSFITALARLGFKLESKDMTNSHFYTFDFTKTGDAPENIKNFSLQLKACLYKKR